ncbi:type II toxin-antitoxin system RelE/ParE family toxin [Emcibacter nanhaiensis]|nr:type II toxin-antitoxin system RelE/ParE family toxin [Emcibacter nanhaiensis]
MAFRLTRKARDDLLSIGRHTARKWGRQQRNFYLKQLDAAFHRLAENPALAPCCDDIRPGYRKYLVGRHVIFFRPLDSNDIEIVRLLHVRMDVDRHL